jgi:hypothetical protein
MNTILIVFGVLIFLIVPVIYIIGAFSCYNDESRGISGKKLGRFEQLNIILIMLSLIRPKMSDVSKIGPGYRDKPVCGFSIISMYFFQNTFLLYILPILGFAMILFAALGGGSPTQNNRGYREANNGSGNNGTGNNGTGTIQGGRRRK